MTKIPSKPVNNATGAAICGAKNRSGRPCRRAPIPGRQRCNLHGGKSTGPRPGNNVLRVHGCYSRYLSPEELEVWEIIKVGSLDDEIRIAKIMLRRALLRARDDKAIVLFSEIIDRQLRTIGRLEIQRAQILGGGVGAPAIEAARAIRAAIDEMNAATRAEPPPDTVH